MPAAAVIPAPIVSMVNAAVKMSVVFVYVFYMMFIVFSGCIFCSRGRGTLDSWARGEI